MKIIIVSTLALCIMHGSVAQSIDKIINEKEAERIEKILAADDMQGRRTFTAGIEKASAFIEEEFKKAGLQTFNGATGYRQEFFMYESKTTRSKITIEGNQIPDSSIAVKWVKWHCGRYGYKYVAP